MTGFSLAHGEHTVDRPYSLGGHLRVDPDFGGEVAQTVAQLLQGVELHVGAVVAAASGRRLGLLGGRGDESLFRAEGSHLVEDTALGCDDKLPGVAFDGIVEQGGRGAHDVGQQRHRPGTFGMHKHLGPGMLLLQADNPLERELLMDMAGAVPYEHLPAGPGADISAEIPVRAEDNLLGGGEGADDVESVGRGHNNVGQRLDGGRSVDIADNRMVGMSLYESLELGGRTGVGQRAARPGVRHKHRLFRTENLGRLPHEMHSAEHNHPVGKITGLAGQRKRVAHHIGQILNLAVGIVMGHDGGVAFLLEALNLPDEPGLIVFHKNISRKIILYRKISKFFPTFKIPPSQPPQLKNRLPGANNYFSELF